MKNNIQAWRKPYMIVLSIVTIIAIVVGLIVHITGFYRDHKNFFNGKSNIENASNIDNDISYEGDKVDEINISVPVSNIIFKTDKYIHVSYNCPTYLEPTVTLDKGVLDIRCDSNVNLSKNIKDTENTITVYLPKHTQVKALDIKVDLGSIELNDLTVDDLSIDADLGDIKLRNLICNAMDIDADLGDVESFNTRHGNVECALDLGNCKLDGDFNTVTVDNSMGNIEITSKTTLDASKTKLNVDLGTIIINGKQQ